MAALEDLEAKIKYLEEIEAIKALKMKYVYSVDSQKPDDVLDCFAPDAHADYGPFGKYETREGLMKFFGEILPRVLPFCCHMVHNPSIVIRGEEAKATWYFDVSCTFVPKFAPRNKASLILGRYDEDLVKVEGKWKYKRMVANIFYFTPLDRGWVEERMMTI